MFWLPHPPPQRENFENLHLRSPLWGWRAWKAAAMYCHGLPRAGWSALRIALGVLVWQGFEPKPAVSFPGFAEGLWHALLGFAFGGAVGNAAALIPLNPQCLHRVSLLCLPLINVMLLSLEKGVNAKSCYLKKTPLFAWSLKWCEKAFPCGH